MGPNTKHALPFFTLDCKQKHFSFPEQLRRQTAAVLADVKYEKCLFYLKDYRLSVKTRN